MATEKSIKFMEKRAATKYRMTLFINKAAKVTLKNFSTIEKRPMNSILEELIDVYYIKNREIYDAHMSHFWKGTDEAAKKREEENKKNNK